MKKIIIYSGAGIDQPSGIQTFRGENGLWNNNNINEICNEFTWKLNFNKVHNFYNNLRKELKNKKPNKAHKIIKEIVNKYGKENVYNITSNITDFYKKLNINTLYIHGELTKMECTNCGNIWDIGYKEFNIEIDRCLKCNSLKAVKPNIVFFNGQSKNYKKMYKILNKNNYIIIVIGTYGNIISIEELIKNKKYSFLNNLEKSKYINEDLFTSFYFEDCLTGLNKIKKEIYEL